MTLRVATAAFAVSADPRRNARLVRAQLRDASKRGARVVHFPECALSGYAGVDFASFQAYDWSALKAATLTVLAEARRLGLWVVVGSSHRLGKGAKPHNSTYVIGPDGAVRDRYDKRFCAGPASADAGDLAHYTSGDHPVVFDLDGVRCAALICHEYRYPELYREAKRAGAQLVFHSYHAGNVGPARWAAMHAATGPDNHRHHAGAGTLPGITMPAAMVSRAGDNHVWISASNTSAKESCWGSFVVRPDGVIVGRLPRNRGGLLITDVDVAAGYYDSTVAWRDRAMDGVLHSGETTTHPRSKDRRSL